MAGLPYLKGVRTKYTNILHKAIDNGKVFLTENWQNVDTKEFQADIINCIGKIKTYSDKLQNQSEKLALAIGDTDEDFTAEIIEEDSDISEKAVDMCFKLQRLESDILEHDRSVSAHYAEEEAKATSSQVHEELHQLFEHQMKLQEDFFERQRNVKTDKPSSVKLPKLDIIPFNGDKLRWIEFWDSFDSAVHGNKSLSDIDKFNYLKNKLVGEARGSIAGLTLSNENYEVAIKILHERFGNKQEVVDLHYNALIDLSPAKSTTDGLRTFLDKVERHLRSLDVLGQNVDQDVFVSMIRKKLPADVLLQLEILNGSDKEWKVESLRALLRQYIVAREKAEKVNSVDISANRTINKSVSTRYNSPVNYSTPPRFERKQQPKIFSEALTTGAKGKATKGFNNRCRYCNNQHWSDECKRFKTICERQKQLEGSCYKCLREGHYSPDCKTSKTCVYCGQVSVHHRSLCPKQFQKKVVSESVQFADQEEQRITDSVQNEESMLLSSGETVLMQTALTDVKHPECDTSTKVRLLMDSGSQRSYITQNLADKLGLKEEDEQEIRLVTFGSENTKVIKTKSSNLDIKLTSGKYATISVNIVPNITGTIRRKPVRLSDWEHFTELTCNMKLADTIPCEAESGTVDLLIGNDFYLDIIMTEKIEVQSGLYLLASRLGWILTGRTPTEDCSESSDLNMLSMTPDTCVSPGTDISVPKNQNNIFLDCEQFGIVKGSSACCENEKAVGNFKQTVIMEDGGCQVTSPLKENRSLKGRQQLLDTVVNNLSDGYPINLRKMCKNKMVCQRKQCERFPKVGNVVLFKYDMQRSDYKFRKKVDLQSRRASLDKCKPLFKC